MTGPLVIYCDASVAKNVPGRPDSSGWGAVFIRDGRIVAEARGELLTLHTGKAEMEAAKLALVHAVESRIVRKGETVFIASDCDAVESYLDDRKLIRRPVPELVVLADRVRAIATKRGLTVIATHVKGHSSDLHNRRADRLARIACGIAITDEEQARRRQKYVDKTRAEAARVRAERKAANLAREEARRGTSKRTAVAVNERFERQLATVRRLQGEA